MTGPVVRADDEPATPGPFWCAECGRGDAATYVVTFLDGDQDDPTGRTEVCRDCDDALRRRDGWVAATRAFLDGARHG